MQIQYRRKFIAKKTMALSVVWLGSEPGQNLTFELGG
jgi:hypothetical protein